MGNEILFWARVLPLYLGTNGKAQVHFEDLLNELFRHTCHGSRIVNKPFMHFTYAFPILFPIVNVNSKISLETDSSFVLSQSIVRWTN